MSLVEGNESVMKPQTNWQQMIAEHIVILTSIRNCKAPGVTFRALLTEDGAERLELVRVQGEAESGFDGGPQPCHYGWDKS